jgi:hypothetical protein
VKIKIQILCLAIVAFGVYSIAGEASLGMQNSPPSVDIAELEAKEFLIKSIPETHYSALVVHTRVSIKSVNEKRKFRGQSVDVAEEVHTYHARVMETFRGRPRTHIQYEVVTEPGEGASVSTAPQILTLCAGPKGLYWPGTGASFPATKEFVAIARRVGQRVAAAKFEHFPQCD